MKRGGPVWNKLLLVLALLPLAADAWVLRSGHGLSFWIRASGFEVCTTFVAAGIARRVFDLLGVGPMVGRDG